MQYKIQEKQSGVTIADNLTYEQAFKIIRKFADDDKIHGVSTIEFYEITPQQSIVGQGCKTKYSPTNAEGEE
jgi:hypothetical protein